MFIGFFSSYFYFNISLTQISSITISIERRTYLEITKVKYNYGAFNTPSAIVGLWRSRAFDFPAHIFYAYKVDGAQTAAAA